VHSREVHRAKVGAKRRIYQQSIRREPVLPSYAKHENNVT
jgi:hypothetical protein